MKFKIVEDFSDPFQLASHYQNHVKRDPNREDAQNENGRFTYMTPQKYQRLANQLASSLAGKSDSDEDIVGYIDDKGMYCKYWKSAKQFVAYVPNTSTIITFYKMNIASYYNNLQFRYQDELPENKEK